MWQPPLLSIFELAPCANVPSSSSTDPGVSLHVDGAFGSLVYGEIPGHDVDWKAKKWYKCRREGISYLGKNLAVPGGL